MMSEMGIKPLNWDPDPGVGYTASRRPDGGMQIVFHELDHTTLEHWRRFALAHLLESDRLTRNLYDLRNLDHISEEAIQYALEVNSDPSTRNLRVAVLVANEDVRQKIEEVAALSAGGGVELGIFVDPADADEWLDRPLTQII